MFAAIAAGNPPQPSQEVPNTNGLQHTILLDSTKPKPYSHITLFILPNVSFPADFVATVYFQLHPDEEFKLFGYLSAEKPSAIYKIRVPGAVQNRPSTTNTMGEIDMDVDEGTNLGTQNNEDSSNLSQVIIGISIERREEGMAKVQQWKEMTRNTGSLVVSGGPRGGGSINVSGFPNASNMPTAGDLANRYPALTMELAAKIVQHAYNYLSGFLDSSGNVPIKCFDSWWEKFKGKLSNDAKFLDEVTKG